MQASSWQSYSLCNETSTQSSKVGNEEGEQPAQQPRVFMCSASVRSRASKSDSATHHRSRDRDGRMQGCGGENWAVRAGMSGSLESQSLEASEVTSG